MNYQSYITEIGIKAKQAYSELAVAKTETKNLALQVAAQQLWQRRNDIITANKIDIENGKAKNLSDALLDRLMLDEQRIQAISDGLLTIAEFEDPVGQQLSNWQPPNGLNITKISVPLGVIGIIYESRPNVTADAGALCLKSGNAAILRGGSDSINSSMEILKCLQLGLKEAGLSQDCVQLVQNSAREIVGEMLKLSQYIDVIVPRGGKSLTSRIATESRIPTIQHLDGNCHIYVHKNAELKKALSITRNAKLRRTGICGAAESLLIDKDIAKEFLPKIIDNMSEVEFRGDSNSVKIDDRVAIANDEDWATEYLDKIISVKIIDNVKEAASHINKYGSHHTDCIITEDNEAAKIFKLYVDSAIVMQNSSTQFADGGEFGMGAEIGISTGRLHARGPVGLSQLVTYKYIVESDGLIRK